MVTTFCKIFKKERRRLLTGKSGDRRLFAKKYKNAAHSLDKPNIRFPLFVGSRKIFKKRFAKLDKPSRARLAREGSDR